MDSDQVIIGVDVGTGSARAGVFTLSGEMLVSAKQDITLYQSQVHYAEQSSEEIWQAVCKAVKHAVLTAGVNPANVAGIGFDATCSLVVVGVGGEPLPVSDCGSPERNIIVWMDHRATVQAERINMLAHPVLKYVGNRISPEMQTPKLLWLKENHSDTFNRAWQFFDLVDYLTWRASGSLMRSVCTVTCKWTWIAHEERWDDSFFEQIGLEEFPQEKYARIGQTMSSPGTACGEGLTPESAESMGLPVGTPVATGMIDAHAGGIGSVGVADGELHNLGYVFGTSSCTMTTTDRPFFIPGIWGPYYSSMVPGLWLNEGGQSAAGAAIDQLLQLHPASKTAKFEAEKAGKSLPVWLADQVLARSGVASEAIKMVNGLHVVPEFLGNRAPFATPNSRAVIAGLSMDNSLTCLMQLYVAGICGIGYGLRQIMQAQEKAGISVDNVVISGGAGQHPLIRQLLADSCRKTVLSTHTPEPVLLGSAILASVAAGCFRSVSHGMKALSKIGQRYTPDAASATQHEMRFDTFEKLQQTAREARG